MSKIICCLEHIELSIDKIVDEFEVPPNIEELSEEKKLSTTCEFCENHAVYMVSN
jgi:CxxH/CxxC protein (TIGR04129 family)